MMEQSMPGIKTVNGHVYIKVQDLADEWHTRTSHILNTGKPNQVPAKYRKTIDGCTWCDVEGLRYRLDMMKRGGKIPGQLRQFLDRFPEDEKHVDDGLGPQKETIVTTNGVTTISRCFLQRTDYASQKEIKVALDNRQVLWRCEKNVQVLAQTLSNLLDTRTSSLLAVNKKQGVPSRFIHRQWKQTWVDLEGLKVRVNHTEHGSALLKGLKQVIELLDAYEAAYTRPLIQNALAPSASTSERKRNASSAKPTACNVAVEANKRAAHNTERLNKLEKRADDLACRVDDMEIADEWAVQAMKEKRTPFDALSKRVGSMVTHMDRLDAKTDGLASRVSVMEDTSKWLSWSLATVIGVRFLALMLRLLRRK